MEGIDRLAEHQQKQCDLYRYLNNPMLRMANHDIAMYGAAEQLSLPAKPWSSPTVATTVS